MNAPAELVASSRSSNKIFLSWKENTVDEDGFIIERKSPEMNDFQIIGRSGSNITEFIDEDVSPDEMYEYQIRAIRGQMTSIASNSAAITAP